MVVLLIDPALLEPHRFMPPPARRRDDQQPEPTVHLALFGIHEDGTDNFTSRTAPSAPGPDQYFAILAGLQAVRARCATGAAPGPRLRVLHTLNRRPENGHNNTGSAASGDDPSCATVTQTGDIVSVIGRGQGG